MNHMRNFTTLALTTMIAGLIVSGTQIVYADETVPVTDPPHHRPHGNHHKHGGITKDAALLLGMERQDLLKEWQKGKTLVQIAQTQKGWNEETFIQKLSDIELKKIDAAIKSGKITEEQGILIKKKLPGKLKNVLNHKHGNHHERIPGTFTHL
ncbi:hypothetical protein [Paenibacillus antarcticus]|uniref:Uncharacterized protein n=1 Tax=Paenibacillus antarcticus TaxID=253703 RepID=A0A168PTH4_9BACL|nr:hypothetical protein [Paenibacillus antarcticus]OAB47062.1 hypothetical protein PBAT_08370 [Paenibacillus antarcticus]